MNTANVLDAWEAPANFMRFASEDREETQSFATSLYCPHEFQLANSEKALTTRIASAALSNVGLAKIGFGANVTVDPGKLDTFYLIQSVVSGTVDVMSGDRHCLSKPGIATVISPDQETKMRWDRNALFLSVKIDKIALEHQLEELIGEAMNEPLVFDLEFSLDSEVSKPWQIAVEALYNQLCYPDWHSCHPETTGMLERWLISTLLNTQRHNYTARIDNSLPKGAPKSLRKAIRYLEQNFNQPIQNKDISHASGISERKLNTIFQSFFGKTAKQYQLDMRLQRVNTVLKNGTHDTFVTSVFEDAGVQHHGRFSSLYKAKYGERPSDTLLNAKDQSRCLSL